MFELRHIQTYVYIPDLSKYILIYIPNEIGTVKLISCNLLILAYKLKSEEKGIPIDGAAATSSKATITSATQAAVATQATSTSITIRQNNTNPFTNKAYSQKYHTLYRKRITLPVFEYRADFMRLLAENQCIVLVGEVSMIQ